MMDRPNFEAWWEEHGQYGRAGGGEYEKTFAYNAWVSQAERIRVLREALEKITACKAVEIRLRQLHEMGHGTDYDQHRQQFADAWVKARAALEATK